MDKINLTSTTVKVEPRVIKTRFKVVMGKPIFGIHKSCWKSFGINNIFQYWLWQRQMRKNWNNGR